MDPLLSHERNSLAAGKVDGTEFASGHESAIALHEGLKPRFDSASDVPLG